MQFDPLRQPVFAALDDLALAGASMGSQTVRSVISDTRKMDVFKGKPQWQGLFDNLESLVSSPHHALPYKVFKRGGNSKMPFWTFSSMPGHTCPGAGDCLNWCYSYKAWQYPHVFGSMFQNMWLLDWYMSKIRHEFHRVFADDSKEYTLRLYVDGDFRSTAEIHMWMDLLKEHPHVKAYGYSKSLEALAWYDTAREWPENYQLNISSGHKYEGNGDLMLKVMGMPITRGTFEAVKLGKRVTRADYGTKDYNAAVRTAAGNSKVFPCPGTCGNCTIIGHACGNAKFKGVPIVIGIH